MLYVVHCFDADNMSSKRTASYAAHRAFLEEAPRFKVTIIMSGPLVKDDGVTPLGSMFVLEAPQRCDVENFHHSDPFYKAGVWKAADISAFKKNKG